MSTHEKKVYRRFTVAQKIILIQFAVIVLLVVALVVSLVTRPHKEAGGVSSSISSVVSDLAADVTVSDVPVDSSQASVSSQAPASSKAPASSLSSKVTSTASSSTAQSDEKWYLRLANGDNVLPSDFSVNTALITPAFARDKGMSFDARAVGDLNNMLRAASNDGVNLLVISCFRTMKRQNTLYENEVTKWKNQGYPDAEARTKAATIVAVPGTSDHNLGLAVDLNSVEESFENTKQFTWLSAHAADYGFVLRYPKDKVNITKIVYEPWHYRYVGVTDAKKMNELHMCLEEYVEYLK